MVEKRCNCCGEVKPLDAYGVDRSCASGLRGECLKCKARKTREAKPRRVQAPKCSPQDVADAWRAARLPVFSPGQPAWRVA